MSSNNKTIFNYLDESSTITQVIKGDKLVGNELKAEITTTFKTLFKTGKVREINKISVDNRGCFIMRFDGTDNVTYINVLKNDLKHYNEFDSMYIEKNRLNHQRIKNLRIFKKTVAGVLVATSIVAGATAYFSWLKNNDNEIFKSMDETNKIIEESAGFNPKAAYEQAMENLTTVIEEEPVHKR